MRFSVDAHAIGCNLTGNEVYIRNLLQGFAAIAPPAEFIAYLAVGHAADAVPTGFKQRRVSGNPFVRLGFDLCRQLRRDRPDLLHVQYTAPLACPVPVVVSVHDVSFVEHPEYFSPARGAQLRLTVRRTVARAAHIITGSEFSRSAIIRAYGPDPDRVAVVPYAAAPLFRPLPRETARAWVRSRFRIAAPFILNVGDLQPRKNQIGLIRAFAAMVRARPELPHHLVLAGQDGSRGGDVRRAAEKSGCAGRIHFIGFVTDDALLQVYNACEFFVFPSFYEGFGLPVLEAMACSRAVACSSTSAIPEVADAAAILFDPYDTAAITRAMLDLALLPDLRARMERLGLQRAAKFNWKNTAEKTLEVYYSVVRRRPVAGTARVASASVLNS
ncbi:MAG: glycosyltransferase family 4 protein [Rhodospirillales bacterium]